MLGSANNGFVQPQLVLILGNGSVWKIIFNNQMNMMSEELLIQLPKHDRYHIFQTSSNTLNFVRNDMTKNIVQFHEDFGSLGHRNIPSSANELSIDYCISFGCDYHQYENFHFKQRQQVGDKVWFFESDYKVRSGPHYLPPFEQSSIVPYSKSTMIWFATRKQWRLGPDIPIEFSRLCSVSLNSTSVLIAFIIEDISNGYEVIGKMAIYDFYMRQWINIQKINIKMYSMACTMTSTFNKKQQQTIMVLTKG